MGDYDTFNLSQSSKQEVQKGLGFSTPAADSLPKHDLLGNKIINLQSSERHAYLQNSESPLKTVSNIHSNARKSLLLSGPSKPPANGGGIHSKKVDKSGVASAKKIKVVPLPADNKVAPSSKDIVKKKRVGKKPVLTEVSHQLLELNARLKASAPPLPYMNRSEKIFEELRSGAYDTTLAKKVQHPGKRTGKRTTVAVKSKTITKKLPKIVKSMRKLRGKTLDLTKMGIIRQKKQKVIVKLTKLKSKQTQTKPPKKTKKGTKVKSKKANDAPRVKLEESSVNSSKGERPGSARKAKVEAANSIKQIYRKR